MVLEAGADAAGLGAVAVVAPVVVVAGATGATEGDSKMTAEIWAVMLFGTVPLAVEPPPGAIVNDDTSIARLRFSMELKKLSLLK